MPRCLPHPKRHRSKEGRSPQGERTQPLSFPSNPRLLSLGSVPAGEGVSLLGKVLVGGFGDLRGMGRCDLAAVADLLPGFGDD